MMLVSIWLEDRSVPLDVYGEFVSVNDNMLLVDGLAITEKRDDGNTWYGNDIVDRYNFRSVLI